jgi:hypothetical protein
MAVQAIACLGLCTAAAMWWEGPALVQGVALAYAAATLLGGFLLLFVCARSARDVGRRFGPASARIGLGVLLMAVPVRLVSEAVQGSFAGHVGAAVDVGLASVTGLLVFVLSQRLLRSPELVWWRSGLRRRRTADATSNGEGG